jgi:phosphatidylglycerol:prolipoprotein diacylglycerol transferase
MHPYITLGDAFVLDSWRVSITMGILAGSLVAWIVLNREVGHTRATIVIGLMAVGALFGAHLAASLLSPGPAHRDLPWVLAFWRGGHSLFGALAFCTVLLLVTSRALPGIPFWPTADAFALGVPLGLFFARIGCHMKGCCWGIPIGEGHPFHGFSVKLIRNDLLVLHPVQLYSAAAALAIFCALLAVHRRQKTPGLLASLFVLLYSSARFFLEFFRGDAQSLRFFPFLTIYQGICMILFLAGLGLLIFILRNPSRAS